MPTFTDQVVWITGASSGIGEHLAYAFAQAGAKLVLSARRADELARVRTATQLPSERVLVLPLDLTQPQQFAPAAAQVLARFGQIDVLVNNGGISQRSFAHQTDLAVDRHVMETNFFGAVGLTKAVLPAMLEQRRGQLVVISSVVGKFGTARRTAYSASKHALHGFFDSLRAELWPHGIRVLLACPGYVRTNISLNAVTADGSPQGTMDDGQAHGLAPTDCARQILRAIGCGKEEVWLGGLKEVAGVYLKRFFPAFFSKIVRKAKVT
jgi:dehydrogenase/reductase SDR family member 7B